MRAPAAAAAVSTAAAGRSSRPPKITAQSANQPQPSASPPITSESQWRSRSTRLAATATAIPTAIAARNCLPWRCSLPSEDERRCCVERSRGRRVAARKRRPEVGRGGNERRTDAADEVLHPQGDELHPGEHGNEERRGPPVPRTHEVECRDRDGKHDHDLDGAEARDPVESAGRERRPVAERPVGDRPVQPLQRGERPDEVGERAEDDAADDRDGDGEREQEARRNLPVEPAGEQRAEAAVLTDRRTDLSCRLERGPIRNGIGACGPGDNGKGGERGEESDREVDEERHGELGGFQIDTFGNMALCTPDRTGASTAGDPHDVDHRTRFPHDAGSRQHGARFLRADLGRAGSRRTDEQGGGSAGCDRRPLASGADLSDRSRARVRRDRGPLDPARAARDTRRGRERRAGSATTRASSASSPTIAPAISPRPR